MGGLGDSRTGPFHHSSDNVWEKKFPNGRTFLVLFARAYNASGLIGPEKNGIAILDKDNERVVLDEHMRRISGGDGPGSQEMQEVERILGMDWPEFSKFMREHRNYRGSVPDANDPEPMTPPKPDPERIIMRDEDIDPNLPSPRRGRNEIMEELGKHSCHREDNAYSPFRISWDIKLHRTIDTSGRVSDFKPNAQYDERWRKLVEARSNEANQLFDSVCEDALSIFNEGLYTTYPGDDQGDYDFAQAGRSGGHLILTRCGSMGEKDLRWENHKEYADWLKELSDEDLRKLYRLVTSVDQSVEKRYEEIAYQYGFQRSLAEEEWKAGRRFWAESDEDEVEAPGMI